MKIVFLATVIFGAALSPLLGEGSDKSVASPKVLSSDGETLPGQGVERLADGEINPTCAWRWQKRPFAWSSTLARRVKSAACVSRADAAG